MEDRKWEREEEKRGKQNQKVNETGVLFPNS
jgi:hypothetical protein